MKSKLLNFNDLLDFVTLLPYFYPYAYKKYQEDKIFLNILTIWKRFPDLSPRFQLTEGYLLPLYTSIFLFTIFIFIFFMERLIHLSGFKWPPGLLISYGSI
jgi:hypothetical protein